MIFKDNIDLKKLNTFGVGAKARHMAIIENLEDARELAESNLYKLHKSFVLGGGSNVLFRGDYDGLIISVDIKGIELLDSSDDHVLVEAGAGESWHDLVEYAVRNNYGGLENLALIPGKTGAAPVQNIGAYGAEQKDVFYSLKGVDLQTGQIMELTYEDCRFAYRDSIFKHELKNRFIICSVTYKLSRQPQLNLTYKELKIKLEENGIINPSIADVFHIVCDIRQIKLPDPEITGNAGSFFKNPVVSNDFFQELKERNHDIPSFPAKEGWTKIPAAWLIEKCGWKGFRKGDAGVSEKHSLVLVNYGSASGADILSLSESIIKDVMKKFNILLEREVLVV